MKIVYTFKDPVVTRIMRDEKIPIISFVANTGGLLGLCMGFSLVSVFEILYHCGGAFKKEFLRRQGPKKPHQSSDDIDSVAKCHTRKPVDEESKDFSMDNAGENSDAIHAVSQITGTQITHFGNKSQTSLRR